MVSKEVQIREAAYHLWELAGKPEGRSLDFWCVAELWVSATWGKSKGNGDWTMPNSAEHTPAAAETAASEATLADDALPE